MLENAGPGGGSGGGGGGGGGGAGGDPEDERDDDSVSDSELPINCGERVSVVRICPHGEESASC